MTAREYPPEVKAAAIAAVTAGASVSAAARQCGVSRRAVQIWRDQAGLTPNVSHEKRVDLGELIGDCLVSGFQALAAIARAASDPEWIKRQDAGQLATFYGVLHDKQLRVVAGLQPTEPITVASAIIPGGSD